MPFPHHPIGNVPDDSTRVASDGLRKRSIEDVSTEIRKLGLPRRSEATQMIREDRDKR